MSRLRVAQAAAVVSRMAKLNTPGLPVVFGADINSWESDRSGYAPHRYLVGKGYADTVYAAGPGQSRLPDGEPLEARRSRRPSGATACDSTW